MAALNERTTTFGPELRRRRLAAGLSLTELGRRVHYTRSYLSRLENGHRRPRPDAARLIDRVLGAGGALHRLVDPRAAGEPGEGTTIDWPRPESSGAAPPGGRTPPDAEVWLDGAATGLRHLRALGQSGSPAGLQLVAEERSARLGELAGRLTGRHRPQAFVLAARYAEFAGWMAQEAGDSGAAGRLTRRAAVLAREGRDDALGAYTLVRQALIALYADRPGEVIELARRAGRETIDDRVRGLARRREAQGHALLGDDLACHRALAEADELLAGTSAGDAGGAPPLGSSHGVGDRSVIYGWCLLELGDPVAATAALGRGIGLVPEQAGRARARLGARLALSLAAAGEVDEACAVAEPVVSIAPLLDSATIRIDLRRFDANIRRWHTHAAVRRIWPALTAATGRPGAAH